MVEESPKNEDDELEDEEEGAGKRGRRFRSRSAQPSRRRMKGFAEREKYEKYAQFFEDAKDDNGPELQRAQPTSTRRGPQVRFADDEEEEMEEGDADLAVRDSDLLESMDTEDEEDVADGMIQTLKGNFASHIEDYFDRKEKVEDIGPTSKKDRTAFEAKRRRDSKRALQKNRSIPPMPLGRWMWLTEQWKEKRGKIKPN